MCPAKFTPEGHSMVLSVELENVTTLRYSIKDVSFDHRTCQDTSGDRIYVCHATHGEGVGRRVDVG